MMCRPEATTFKLHGAKEMSQCVSMADMDSMRAAMHEINPSLAFIPLVYHSEAAWAVGQHSYVIGAVGKFVPPSKASVSMILKSPNNAATTLRFYYNTKLSAWNQARLIAQGQSVNGTIMFEASVNRHVVLTVDASVSHGIKFFEADISRYLLVDGSVNVSFATFPTAAAADRNHLWMQRDCYKTSYVFGVSLNGDDKVTPPLNVEYVKTGDVGVMSRQPTEAIITGHSEAMIFHRAQDPADQLSTPEYTKLLSLVKNSNPRARVFGGHYARLGEPWTKAVSSTSLRDGLGADRTIGLAGSLIFQMPIMAGRCRSMYDTCNEGIFHQRQLPKSHSGLKYNGVLFWPNEADALGGWYQRYSSDAAVQAKTQLTIALSDSQALDGEPSATRDEFRKRIYGLTSGIVYYEASVGVFVNKSTTCGAEGKCPGAGEGIKCEIVCSGPGMGLSKVTLTTMHREQLAVELRTGSLGSTHAQTAVRVLLPAVSDDPASSGELVGWTHSSGLAEGVGDGPYLGFFDLSVRALYNTTVEAFARAV